MTLLNINQIIIDLENRFTNVTIKLMGANGLTSHIRKDLRVPYSQPQLVSKFNKL
jgi:hypothetical protein